VGAVAWAYKELEASRLVVTRGRHGTFVIATRQRVVDEETRAVAPIVARTPQRAAVPGRGC
jgi:DNA-binding transcriptional regulator YhcF (GntR family)